MAKSFWHMGSAWRAGGGITSRGPQGFTFIEVMIVAAIMVVFAMAMMVLAQTGRGAWLTTQSRLNALTDAQRAINWVSNDLRNASQASVSCPSPTSLQVTVGGSTIVYTHNAVTSQLLRAVDGGPASVVASDVTAFTPDCSSVVVRYVVTVSDPMGIWPIPQTIESRVWVQNP